MYNPLKTAQAKDYRARFNETLTGKGFHGYGGMTA